MSPEMSEAVQPRHDPCGSGSANVLRLGTLRALGHVELHLLVVLKGLVSGGLDRRVVNEDVVAAALLLDETEPLLCAEPLHGALSHCARNSYCRGESRHLGDPQRMR